MDKRIRVIQKGSPLPTGAVRRYVGRPTILGNPFSHLPGTLAQHRVATREEAVHRHEVWLDNLPRDSPQWREIESLAGVLRDGFTLALECWCGDDPPLGHCHATTIAAEVLRVALHSETSSS